MTKYNIILFFTIVIVNVFHILCYKELSCCNNVKKNYKSIILLVIISIIITINTLYSNNILKPLLSCLCLLICFFYVFDDSLNRIISYGVLSYVIAIFCELIMSIILAAFNISLSTFESNIFIKSGFSISVLISAFFLCRLSFFKKIGFNLSLLISKSKLVIFSLVISMIIPLLLDFKYVNSISTSNYIINIFLTIVFETIVSILIFYEYRSNKEMQKYENLLNFLSKYEKIIDEQRIKRHEIHNNLLVLNSYKNKNSKEYKELLNNLINYYSKTEDVVKNMYKLPNGIKGIVYYKLMNINKKNIKLNVNISKKINFKIEKNNNKEYISLCKILGIVLDNAIEACNESIEKRLCIEMYSENNKIVFLIFNSFNKEKINIDKINELHYSSKGKGRGYGLSIAYKILSTSKYIKMKQYVNEKYFFTDIEIDN